MEKQYYSIVKRYDSNPFSAGLMTPVFCNFYHGYIFRKDEDGPSLIYDAVFTNGDDALEDLKRVGEALGLQNLIRLGIFSSSEYENILEDIFKK